MIDLLQVEVKLIFLEQVLRYTMKLSMLAHPVILAYTFATKAIHLAPKKMDLMTLKKRQCWEYRWGLEKTKYLHVHPEQTLKILQNIGKV